MISVDDRKTWVSTAVPVAARLELRRDVSARTILDGAWWPRSREPVTELVNLVAALDARGLPVIWVMLNTAAWDSHPRRIGVPGRTVRLGWFNSLEADLLIAGTGSDRRVDLLVIAPQASASLAAAAMSLAYLGDETLTAAGVLAAAAAPAATPAAASRPGREPAEEVWESEGGRVNGHRPAAAGANTATIAVG